MGTKDKTMPEQFEIIGFDIELQQLPYAAVSLAKFSPDQLRQAGDHDLVELVEKARTYLHLLLDNAQVRYRKDLQ